MFHFLVNVQKAGKQFAEPGKINESHCCYCRTEFDSILMQELMLVRSAQELAGRWKENLSITL